MRRITMWFMSTFSALVILFSYHTSTDSATANANSSLVRPATTQAATAKTTTSSSSSSGSDTSTGTAHTTTRSATKSATRVSIKTVTGRAVDTIYGPVQVQLTVTNGKITAVKAIDYPMNNGMDQQINTVAIPQLNAEATKAKSASISMVSGASYTSTGYISSLQSAIDKANL